MKYDVPNTTELPLEQRIRQWIEDNPNRAHAGERMLEQLHRIRTEFHGDTQARLEALVEETLHRQLNIDKNKRAGLQAAKKLSEKMAELTESMASCLVTARKAHDAAVGAAMSAMAVRAQAKRQKNPLSFTPKQKKFVN